MGDVENALGVLAIWVAVNFISGTFASWPLKVMQGVESSTKRATDGMDIFQVIWAGSRRKPIF
ncbi:hypothetical protein OAN81_01920 [Paracoccaceae bacterium]|nr:hypothetical protein [Paracoccaceae bacterium]